MSKCNPGPWRVDSLFRKKKFDENTGEPIAPVDYHYVKDADDFSVVLLAGIGEQYLANARLIAAAPELLEALQAYLKAGMIGSDIARAHETARKVIAKATGGEE